MCFDEEILIKIDPLFNLIQTHRAENDGLKLSFAESQNWMWISNPKNSKSIQIKNI